MYSVLDYLILPQCTKCISSSCQDVIQLLRHHSGIGVALYTVRHHILSGIIYCQASYTVIFKDLNFQAHLNRTEKFYINEIVGVGCTPPRGGLGGGQSPGECLRLYAGDDPNGTRTSPISCMFVIVMLSM